MIFIYAGEKSTNFDWLEFARPAIRMPAGVYNACILEF